MKDLPKLRSILNYHIVNGKIDSSEIHSMTKDGRTPTQETLQGSAITLKTDYGTQRWIDSKQTVFVNDAKVVRPEIEASNGMIHVIDRVLLPMHTDSTTQTITDTRVTTNTLTTT